MMKALINDIPMAYDDEGQGPAVMLLHGFPFNRKMWQPQLKSLAENGFRVIAPDLRGFGETPSGDKPFAIETHTDDVIKLMSYLGIGRAVIITSSTTGQLVLDMSQRYPNRLTASCLLSPELKPTDPAEQIRLQDIAGLVREGQHRTAIDVLCDQYLPENKSLHTQQQAHDVRTWIETADKQSLAGWLTYLIKILPEKTTASEPFHSLVLTGEQNLNRSDVNGLFKNAITQTISGAGHLVNLDKSSSVNSSLLDFLRWLSINRTRHPALSLAA